MLFATLMPSISHAVATARGVVWTEICSVAGTRLVKVDSGAGVVIDQSDSAAVHVQHCPFCATHADGLAMLPSSRVVFSLPAAAAPYPRLYYQSPHPLPVWTAAQSRAPPALA